MKLEEYKNEKSEQHPWLVICHGFDEQKLKQTFFSISENRCYMRSIPELQNKIIRAYVDEWLVLEDIDSNDCYLWNPISNDKIQLPSIPEYCHILKCLLSAPPHDPECLLLFLIEETTCDDENSDDDENPDDDENSDDDDTDDDENPDDEKDVNPPALYFCKTGYNQEFHKQDLQSTFGDNTFVLWTVFKRKFYVLTWQTRILLRLDLDNDSGTITVTPMTNQPPDVEINLDMSRYENYLIQSPSCDDNHDMLLYVHLFFDGNNHTLPYDFLIFRFDSEKKAWVKMESIGEIAIFVTDRSSAATTCSTRGTNIDGESIYFTEGRYLYIFNMKKERLLLSLPCPHVSKRKLLSYWSTLPFQQ